jgi:hypothetical protein
MDQANAYRPLLQGSKGLSFAPSCTIHSYMIADACCSNSSTGAGMLPSQWSSPACVRLLQHNNGYVSRSQAAEEDYVRVHHHAAQACHTAGTACHCHNLLLQLLLLMPMLACVMQKQGYVSRAAFKLIEIQKKHKVIKPGGK